MKIKLSSGGATLLRHRKKLDVVLTIVTEASGDPSVTKTYDIVLSAAQPVKSKH